MLTGVIKSRIDRIWDAFWSSGISNPLEVIEQIAFLLFPHRLDDPDNTARSAVTSDSHTTWVEKASTVW
jgi:hypothetical protein